MKDDWRDWAFCQEVGPEVFFAPENTEASTSAAIYREGKKICAGCPVESECLDWALKVEDQGLRYGVWGGMTPGERDELWRMRNAA